MLRKQKLMEGMNRSTVTYCQYGHTVQKPTDIWNNCSSWTSRPMCKPGAECHERASRGARKGVQGIYSANYHDIKRSAKLRAIIPKELCLEIIKCCEKEWEQK